MLRQDIIQFVLNDPIMLDELDVLYKTETGRKIVFFHQVRLRIANRIIPMLCHFFVLSPLLKKVKKMSKLSRAKNSKKYQKHKIHQAIRIKCFSSLMGWKLLSWELSLIF